ncbi:MAG: OmpA family protein [Actinomycetota bacterium]|nr:OmpA family protein [Actinomycetota bacterium]
MARKSKTTKRLQQLDRSASQRSAAASPAFRSSGDDEPAASWSAFIAGVLLIFVVFTAIAVFVGTRSVEADLEARSEQSLRLAGFGDISAHADGFSVALKGQYNEDQDIASAEQAVRGLTGVAAVDATGVWAVAMTELEAGEIVGSPVAFVWSSDSVEVHGDLSTEEQRAFVSDSLGALETENGSIRFASVDATDIQIVEGLESEDEWIGKAVALVGSLSNGLEQGAVTVNPSGEVVTTEGKTETRQEKFDLMVASEDFIVALEVAGFDLTDGVLGPPKPPPPTRQEVEELERTLAELIEGKVVEFEFASDELTDVGKALLDELLVPLREFSAVSIRIEGHADAQGSPERNLELSFRRAQAVVGYFVEQGEDSNRFVAVGYGDTRPIADNATAEGRQKNRRIEFIALED